MTQPQLTGYQRELELVSDQADWGLMEKTGRVLAEFPLPGASTGTPAYLLYLRWPVSEDEPKVGDPAGAGVRGFFIQTRNRYAGITHVKSGTVEVEGASTSGRAKRRLRIALTCEDGSRIEGEIRARRDDHTLRRFELYRRPADVQALLESSPAPDDTGATPPPPPDADR